MYCIQVAYLVCKMCLCSYFNTYLQRKMICYCPVMVLRGTTLYITDETWADKTVNVDWRERVRTQA